MMPYLKKIILFLAALALMPVSLLAVFYGKYASAEIAPPRFVIDGKPFAPPAGEPAPYINKDSRTMVPIRFFAEALGVPNDEAHIGWYQEIRTAVISHEDRVISVRLGERHIQVNDEVVPMDTAAEIRHSRVFIPVRYIAEALDANVQWDNDNRTIIIFSKEFLENHRAMQTGRLKDLDDPWIVPAFYEKWKTKVDVARYDGPEHLQRVVRDVRDIAARVRYEIDEANGSVTVTLPDYDQKKYRALINSATGEQVRGPGVSLTIRFVERNRVNDGLFEVGIGDYQFGYVMASIYGFYNNGSIEFVEGTLARERVLKSYESGE